MKTVRLLLVAFATLVASCTSPLASLKLGQESLAPVAANESRIVFHFELPAKAAYNYTTANVGFLVVQVHSKHQQSSKFAAAKVTAGSATVTFTGLAAGPWELQASCYDWDGGANGTAWTGSTDKTQPYLLFTGMDEVVMNPGTSKSVSLLLYKPGDISGVTMNEAKLVDSVTLEDQAAGVDATVLEGAPVFLLTATALASDLTLASEQRFEWSSSKPEVATVNNAGLVTPYKSGTTIITATSFEGHMTGVEHSASYTLTVNPVLVGYWKSLDPYTSVETYKILKISQESSGLQARYLTGLGASGPVYPFWMRGPVTVDGSGWKWMPEKQFDFGTGTESTVAAPMPGTVTLNGSDLLTLSYNAMTYKFERIEGAVGPGSLSLPGNVPAYTMLDFASFAPVGNYSLGQLVFSSSNNVATPVASSYQWVSFVSFPATSMVTIRSVEDPAILVSQNVTTLGAVAPPSGVVVTSPNSTTIHLLWTDSNSAPASTGVDVYRSTDGSTFTKLTASPLLVDSYDDTGLTPATQYYYRLITRRDAGLTLVDSPFTEVIPAYTLAPGNVPAIVVARTYDPGQYVMSMFEHRDRGDGLWVPAAYRSTSVSWHALQGYESDGNTFSNKSIYFHAGEFTWAIYSKPVTGAGTLVVQWNHKGVAQGMPFHLPAVDRVWQATASGTTFTLHGASGTTGTLAWNGTIFN